MVSGVGDGEWHHLLCKCRHSYHNILELSFSVYSNCQSISMQVSVSAGLQESRLI